ncbi:chromosome segregation protein [Zalerion maritima]|uniref:Chromosome segregation protein n=1 Tax=Zalerion maritima TaxID=339359 RepID=A0AAD5WSE6_9PEZI|nr:chromosome segregation protein [Zalerion maritima]
MSSRKDLTLHGTRRARKSIGGPSPRKAIDQENATVDVSSTLAASRKKSRSKSMGPGGFDALKSSNGNRRASLAVPSRPPPRSILKPTMPVLQDIPPPKSKKHDLTIDLSQAPGTKVALRTEEQQQAAATERDRLEKEVNDRREARRKSLANRRVSFAAEATLHTFHEIEYMQDSTTSTDSTRRRSSVAPPPQPESDPPSTPPAQAEGDAQSLGTQRDFDQQNQRRSSIMSTGDDTLASTVYSSDSEHGDEVINEQIVEDDGSDSSDSDDVTMMTVDDVTGTSVGSRRTISREATDNIDEALQLARQTARSNAAIDEDEEEIVPGLMGWGKNAAQSRPARRTSDDFTTTTQHGPDSPDDQPMEMTMDMDMEETRPLGGIIKSGGAYRDTNPNEDMSMDVTNVIGGILSQAKDQTQKLNMSTRPSDDSMEEDEPMEITTAMGGIRDPRKAQDNTEMDLEDEDMSMEMTMVMGRVLQNNNAPSGTRSQSRRRTITAPSPEEEDEDVPMELTVEAPMEMTVGLGRILPARSPEREEQGEAMMAMDMTTTVGGIMGQSPEKDDEEGPTMAMEMTTAVSGRLGQLDETTRSVGKRLMEEEANKGDDFLLNSSPFKNSPSPKKIPAPRPDAQSHSLGAFKGKGLRKSLPASKQSTTPQSKSKAPTSKEPTPKTPKDSTTPSRSASPKRKRKMSLSPKKGGLSAATSPKSPAKSPGIFQKDPATGLSTPRVALTPRRLSGFGADRPGLGSPKVSELLDRRTSIGDSASVFSPIQLNRRTVAFEDPNVIEAEIDKERQEEEDREDSRKIMEREADGNTGERDVTLNLKDLIQSLSPSPKYQPLHGRKSLAVGSGRALLGKRPAELDDSDDDQNDGVKRLKGHQGSPVKNVKLQHPPSKAETTGRVTRSSARKSQNLTSGSIGTPSMRFSPVKKQTATTPKDQGRFKDMKQESTPIGVRFDEPATVVDELSIQSYQNEDSEERIHLQDFLNMTSIRFMELNTTKRRATAAPESFVNKSLGEEETASLERCVVAGACTVPMLELYQHSCRELKKYISEGRKIVREIESETFEVNPPLFREYISAAPEYKVLMDNQFKNVKTNARLQSKAMWYEWRMKLQDGLKEGLLQTVAGMDADEKILTKQKNLLDSILLPLLQKFKGLAQENKDRQAYADELADCDPEELDDARQELTELESDVESKKNLIANLRGELDETQTDIGNLKAQKETCVSDIQEAERVREQCRGWSIKDVSVLKARAEAIEKRHGWAITGVSGTVVSMTYKRDIELVFDTRSFKKPNSRSPTDTSNSQIDVWYVAAARERNPQPSTPEKEFFLDLIRDHARGLVQADTEVKDLLSSIANAWGMAATVAKDVKLLNTTFPTQVVKTSDNSIAVKSVIMVKSVQTKVEVILSLRGHSVGGQVEVGFHGEAKVVYGEKFNEPTMAEFLKVKIGDERGANWSDVLVELQQRLVARGRKG